MGAIPGKREKEGKTVKQVQEKLVIEMEIKPGRNVRGSWDRQDIHWVLSRKTELCVRWKLSCWLVELFTCECSLRLLLLVGQKGVLGLSGEQVTSGSQGKRGRSRVKAQRTQPQGSEVNGWGLSERETGWPGCLGIAEVGTCMCM